MPAWPDGEPRPQIDYSYILLLYIRQKTVCALLCVLVIVVGIEWSTGSGIVWEGGGGGDRHPVLVLNGGMYDSRL